MTADQIKELEWQALYRYYQDKPAIIRQRVAESARRQGLNLRDARRAMVARIAIEVADCKLDLIVADEFMTLRDNEYIRGLHKEQA